MELIANYFHKTPSQMCDTVLNAPLRSLYFTLKNIWVKVFKNGPNKICGRQPF